MSATSHRPDFESLLLLGMMCFGFNVPIFSTRQSIYKLLGTMSHSSLHPQEVLRNYSALISHSYSQQERESNELTHSRGNNDSRKTSSSTLCGQEDPPTTRSLQGPPGHTVIWKIRIWGPTEGETAAHCWKLDLISSPSVKNALL